MESPSADNRQNCYIDVTNLKRCFPFFGAGAVGMTIRPERQGAQYSTRRLVLFISQETANGILEGTGDGFMLLRQMR